MMSLSLRECAVCYAQNGLWVFPLYGIGADGRCECKQPSCRSPGKHPAREAPHGHLDATCDVARITAIWTTHPNRNIGISVGASGLGVVDIDCGKGKDGEASLAKLETKHGILPLSWEVITGSGGRHIYFRADRFPTNTNTYGEPHVDTRGVGGYVVAPPSRHISGGTYRWKEGKDPRSLSVADAPAWLLQAAPTSARKPDRLGSAIKTSITRNPVTGLVIDGRETFLRNVTHSLFWEMLGNGGSAPDAILLAAATWQRFSTEADLKDQRWGERDAIKYAHAIVKRYHAGKLAVTPQTSKVIADIVPYFMPALFDGNDASKRLNKIMGAFIKAHERHMLAKAELEHVRENFAEWSQSARECEMRKVRDELRQRFGSKCFEPPRLQIAAPAGTGKTSFFVWLYAQHPFLWKLHINYYVPTLERARDFEADLHAAFAKLVFLQDPPKVRVMHGRTDPHHGRCHPDRKELVRLVEKKVPSIYNTLCVTLDTSTEGFPADVKCPHYDECAMGGYIAQYLDKEPQLRIWPHAQLPLQQNKDLKLPDADLVIVDESCVGTLCKSPSLAIAELSNARNYLNADGGIDQTALDTGNRVLHAIQYHQGSLQLDALVASSITSQELSDTAEALRHAASVSALVVQPHWSPESIRTKATEHQSNWAGTVARVFEAMAASMDAGRSECTVVSLEADQVSGSVESVNLSYQLVCSYVTPPMLPADAGLLLLDADASVEVNRRLFDARLRHVTIRAKRRGYVRQVYIAPYATSTLTSPRGGDLRNKIASLVDQQADRGKKVLVGCSLKVRKALTGESGTKLPQSVGWLGAEVTHFGAFIGSNAWKDFDVVIVLGREEPPARAMEKIARALWPDEGLALPGSYITEVRGYHLRNGERAGVEVRVHADPLVQMILDLHRERATGQLVDRLRLMYPDGRQPEIMVVSNLPIPGLTVDELVTLEELLEGGSQWHCALRSQGGVLPMQAEYLSNTFMFSTLFGSARSIARNIGELLNQRWRRPTGTRIVQYRQAGSRGPLSSALVAGSVENCQVQLALRHGLAREQVVVEICQTEKLCQLPNNTIRGVTGFFRLSDDDAVGVVPRPGSKSSWQVLARQLGRPVDALRKRFGSKDGRRLLDAAYEAPGSLWRLHLKGQRYAVDVKLPGITVGDQAATKTRLEEAGLECSWIIPKAVEKASAEVVLFRPKAVVDDGKCSPATVRRVRGRLHT